MNTQAAYALLLAAAFWGGWTVNGWRHGEAQALRTTTAVQEVRALEHQAQAVADVEGDKVEKELIELRGSYERAADDADGLRIETRKLTARLNSCKAETAAEREARERAADMLANVLSQMEAEGRRMALIADERGARGRGVERIYGE